MPRILITRPRAASETTAAKLQKLGYQTVIEPLLSITLLPTAYPADSPIDAIMITSANALTGVEGRRKDVSSLFNKPCFCVGDYTAEKARAFGFRKTQSAYGDGAALARLVGAALGGAKASILHIAGRDVNGLAQGELEKHGHRIIVWPVYEAIPATALTGSTTRMLKENACAAALLYSPRTAAIMVSLLGKDLIKTCCASLPAICLSEAVAESLRPFGWQRLIIAPQPAEDVMIASIQRTCPVDQ